MIEWHDFHLCRPILAFLCQRPGRNHQKSSKHSPLKRVFFFFFYDCVTFSGGWFQCYPPQTAAELSAAHSTHTKAFYPMAGTQRPGRPVKSVERDRVRTTYCWLLTENDGAESATHTHLHYSNRVDWLNKFSLSINMFHYQSHTCLLSSSYLLFPIPL